MSVVRAASPVFEPPLEVSVVNRTSILMLTAASFSAAAGQLLFKVGASGRQQLADFVNLPIIAGLFLYGIGTVMWIYALSSQKLVNVYVFTALTFVLVYAAGIVLLKEQVSGPAMVGIGLVLCGLYLITG
ncbi:MAG: EamA family transporter, partial [Pseudomonadales bacterium]|nr:EamA family transporter [Pseudomonadales bacterium]